MEEANELALTALCTTALIMTARRLTDCFVGNQLVMPPAALWHMSRRKECGYQQLWRLPHKLYA
jgi:hypothetical protein